MPSHFHVTRLETLEDAGLKEALGERSDDLLQHAYDARQALSTRARSQLKTAAKVIGLGGTLVEGGPAALRVGLTTENSARSSNNHKLKENDAWQRTT